MIKALQNRLALTLFDAIALTKGFRFEMVGNAAQQAAADKLYAEEGFSFPEKLANKVRSYKAGTVSFIAYSQNEPVGMVRLADPEVQNRPYELYGVDVEGEHFEIQSLLVKPEHRDGTQFVMLGLFRQMYSYSMKNDITSWSSCGMRNVYLTMKRFCKAIEVHDVDFEKIDHPLTQYLFSNNIIDTYFTMQVSAFEPWTILRRFVRLQLKKISKSELLPIKRNLYARPDYRCK